VELKSLDLKIIDIIKIYILLYNAVHFFEYVVNQLLLFLFYSLAITFLFLNYLSTWIMKYQMLFTILEIVDR